MCAWIANGNVNFTIDERKATSNQKSILNDTFLQARKLKKRKIKKHENDEECNGNLSHVRVLRKILNVVEQTSFTLGKQVKPTKQWKGE